MVRRWAGLKEQVEADMSIVARLSTHQMAIGAKRRRSAVDLAFKLVADLGPILGRSRTIFANIDMFAAIGSCLAKSNHLAKSRRQIAWRRAARGSHHAAGRYAFLSSGATARKFKT